MNRITGKRFTRHLSSGLTVLATFLLLISLNAKLETAFAAQDPAATAASSPQGEPLEIPGSFKDLSEAKDKVTVKRSVEQIGPLSSGKSLPVDIDATKVAAKPSSGTTRRAIAAQVRSDASWITEPNGAAYADSEMQDFHATAYCLKGRTASGVTTRPGVIAADPRVLPIGTVVHLRAGRYTGTYTVLDTGGRIKGRRVDVYVPTHREAMQFGRRPVKIKVISRSSGKADRASTNLAASGK